MPVIIPTSSPLLGDKQTALANFRLELSMGAANYLPASLLSNDDLLWNYLLQAEAQAEQQLNVFFGAVQVVPDDAPQSEIDALEAAGTRYVTEAAYDFEGDMFYPDKFGFIALGHQPVQAVNSVTIITPTPFLSDIDIPQDWIRLNKKYGQLRFYPSTSEVTILNNYGLGFMNGATFPNAVKVRYVTGIINADGSVPSSYAGIYPNLTMLVNKMAGMSMLQSSFPASSGSISADGLSQSKSIDMDKWQDGINQLIYGPKGSNGGLYTAIHGVMVGVLG